MDKNILLSKIGRTLRHDMSHVYFVRKNYRVDVAEVIICTWWTTRELTGCAPKLDSSSYALQWVVASSPLRRPAAPSNSDPVQTEVVYRLVSCTYTKS